MSAVVALVLLSEEDQRVRASSDKSCSSDEARARSLALRSQVLSKSGVLTQNSRSWRAGGLSSWAEQVSD